MESQESLDLGRLLWQPFREGTPAYEQLKFRLRNKTLMWKSEKWPYSQKFVMKELETETETTTFPNRLSVSFKADNL